MNEHLEDRDFDLLPPLDDMAGPAKRISSARAATMIQAAMEGTAIAAAPVRPPSRVRVALVAAALLAFASAASAGIYTFVVADDAEPAVEPPPRPRPAPAPEPALEPEPEPEPEFEILPDEPEPEPIVKERRAPKDLIRIANARRGDKRYREADRIYQQVIKQHARSAEAYVATVASAQLRLDHLGSPRSALRLYRRALAMKPSGPLSEEARFGLAETYRALGNRAAERKALRAFLAKHPASPLKARAESRLETLEE